MKGIINACLVIILISVDGLSFFNNINSRTNIPSSTQLNSLQLNRVWKSNVFDYKVRLNEKIVEDIVPKENVDTVTDIISNNDTNKSDFTPTNNNSVEPRKIEAAEESVAFERLRSIVTLDLDSTIDSIIAAALETNKEDEVEIEEKLVIEPVAEIEIQNIKSNLADPLPIQSIAAPTAPSSTTPLIDLEPNDSSLSEQTYVMCGNCKAAFLFSLSAYRNKGTRVKCSICDKDWFQTVERLMKTDSSHQIVKMPDHKITEVKRILADKNVPKYPRVDKIGIFIGNLPYDFGEKEIGDLFGEYGVTNVALVRDNEGQSKGYAFLEVASAASADLIIQEMHHFYTEPNRKLSVRLSTPPSARPTPTPRRETSDRSGNNFARSDSRPTPQKSWNPR
eukprot:gene6025-8297_t